MAHPLISRLFEKAGIKNADDLKPEERETYQRWEAILSQGEITVDRIREFCENQKRAIESQWKDLSNPQRSERLIAQHVVYSSLLDAINAPATERITLEKYLQQLLQTK